jgi:hypothetical protein
MMEVARQGKPKSTDRPGLEPATRCLKGAPKAPLPPVTTGHHGEGSGAAGERGVVAGRESPWGGDSVVTGRCNCRALSTEAVLSILKGETSVAEATREHGRTGEPLTYGRDRGVGTRGGYR